MREVNIVYLYLKVQIRDRIDKQQTKVKLTMKKPKNISITGRVSDWMKNPDSRLPVSCTVFDVKDSMEGRDGIEQSWVFTSGALRYGAGVAINLSNLRSKGSTNTKGLVASGAVSFAQIYSQLNEVLRRGGIYKNGAVVVYLDYNHSDIVEFLNATPKDLPWAKKALYVDEHLLESPSIDLIIQKVKDGSIWLAKKQWDNDGNRLYSNVCVTENTWVQTSFGARQVKDLIDNVFEAHIDGKNYLSLSPNIYHEELGIREPSGYLGFFPTGVNPVFQLTTKEGYSVEVTEEHEFLLKSGHKVKAKQLKSGDKIQLNQVCMDWKGSGTYGEGWLIGSLVGDGTFSNKGSAIVKFWGKHQEKEVTFAHSHITELGATYSEINKRYYPLPVIQRNLKNDYSLVGSRQLALLAHLYDIKPREKTVTPEIEKASKQFYRGFISGLFDADATVCGNESKREGKSVSLTSIRLDLIQGVQRMLLRLGVVSRICKGQEAKFNVLPDGKGGKKEFWCNQAYRLIITGRTNLTKFSEICDFNHPQKSAKLKMLLSTYTKSAYDKGCLATFQSLDYIGDKPTYDCTIDDVHQFDANGFKTPQCLEILLKSRASCLLAHTNLGKTAIDEIPQAFEDGMKFLCELHPQTGVDKSGLYLSPNEDKQVGLGVLGLANLLAIEKVKYSEFVDALETAVYDTKNQDISLSSKAVDIVDALLEGFNRAKEVASKHGMQRAFTIAPTASVAYRNRDREMFTTAPEISPPINNVVDRDSGTFGVTNYEHNPKSETAREVGWDVQYRLMKAWQSMMDRTGLAHSISFNIWNTCTVDKDFIADWLTSPLKTTYYRLSIEQDFLDKSRVITDVNMDKDDSIAVESCNLDGICTSCAE
jgi:LAGLIDADG-like domain/Ribonucleotide reductase, barrel domain